MNVIINLLNAKDMYRRETKNDHDANDVQSSINDHVLFSSICSCRLYVCKRTDDPGFIPSVGNV